ncbi:MarR family transcriptional regulator [Nonlabens sp. MB-3u-79]|uniref:MarR family winged helix-turn-helix transcriptional regulator n=1 Tax=Nonlabens sp. MB-3u-79 TaxID=2058134 RepID=UPI000C30BB2C|nr:MarR family transcriptional regulator [Nonlabens sp. MB-3u-79]AUC79703.1 MarR family transcriptional regulator [Nonlabens sp. MB-3u-79]|tara:strand:- start:777 stop:1235 length:459 start_codon:yes stop_codon:yes gene_type:complete
MNKQDQLKLSSQVCFPIYSVSRLLTKSYKPYLDKMGITYPQYLVLLVLWENDEVTVNQITDKLLLNTNTVSPLLKRMQQSHLIERHRCTNDERRVIIQLTDKGKELKKEAIPIPEKLLQTLLTANIELPDIINLKELLEEWIGILGEQKQKQ